MFSGAIVAIVTPFSDGKIDEKAYKGLINDVITGGVRGIVPCGTTGSPPLCPTRSTNGS